MRRPEGVTDSSTRRATGPRAAEGRRARWMFFGTGAMGLVIGSGCGASAPPPRPRPPGESIQHAPAHAGVAAAPAILGAQVGEPTLVDLDPSRPVFAVIYVVFSADVDPATVAPDFFLVALDDGRRIVPARASLAPADEPDENRTVALVLARPAAAKAPPRPLAVSIVGEVYAEGGEPLIGLSAQVEAGAGPRLVHAARVAPGPRLCAGAEQAVRLYWSLPVVDEAIDLAALRVTLADGSAVHPRALDDHEGGPAALQRADNVIDLCLDPRAEATRLSVEAGAFHDLYGRPSAAADAAVARLRAE